LKIMFVSSGKFSGVISTSSLDQIRKNSLNLYYNTTILFIDHQDEKDLTHYMAFNPVQSYSAVQPE